METLLIIFLKRFSPSPNMLCKRNLLIIVYSSRFSLLLASSSVSCLLLSSLCSNTEVLGHYLIVFRNLLTFELGSNLATSDLKKKYIYLFSSFQLSHSVMSDLCDPMNRSMPGLPVHHQLPEFTQTHVHRVSDVIQPSHPLSSPSPPAPNPSQHQSLFQ